jgi:predicted nucleic acid-binding protein
MAFLFDTDAITELLRRRPLASYVEWLSGVPREEQFTSGVVIGELYGGAYRSSEREHHLANIEDRVLPAVTVLPYDLSTAHVFGEISAHLEAAGTMLADADLQIAATAVHHGLHLITGNLRHFERIPGLVVDRVLAEARRSL